MEYLPYAEVMATPPAALQARLAALQRRRARERVEDMTDATMTKEINRGQSVIGKMPKSDLKYKIVDTPFERHFKNILRAAEGLPPLEVPEDREARIRAEKKRMESYLLN